MADLAPEFRRLVAGYRSRKSGSESALLGFLYQYVERVIQKFANIDPDLLDDMYHDVVLHIVEDLPDFLDKVDLEGRPMAMMWVSIRRKILNLIESEYIRTRNHGDCAEEFHLHHPNPPNPEPIKILVDRESRIAARDELDRSVEVFRFREFRPYYKEAMDHWIETGEERFHSRVAAVVRYAAIYQLRKVLSRGWIKHYVGTRV